MEERKFKFYDDGRFTEALHALLNPYFHLIKRSPNSKWDGWETLIFDNPPLRKWGSITLRAIEVSYDRQKLLDNPLEPWMSYKYVKYEVKPNTFGVLFIEYRGKEGFYVVGENIVFSPSCKLEQKFPTTWIKPSK